jgi:hypothetical protein
MKKVFSFIGIIALFIALSLNLNSCRDKTFEKSTFTANVPVYMDRAEFRASVKSGQPRQLQQPGKIYIKDNLLFVNELLQGVHVFNNTNPASPQYITFIEIPGNVDIVIMDNILFADSFIDLVAIDISNPSQPLVVDRIENVFPNTLPPFDGTFPIHGLDYSKGIVVGWEQKVVTETIDHGSYQNRWVVFDGLGRPMLGGAEIRMTSPTVGQGGSMARFTIRNKHMYAVHNSKLMLFDLNTVPGIKQGVTTDIPRIIETIFPLEDKLFLGTTTGMLIYDVSNPSIPAFVSEISHINSCDPVVAQDTIAYVTLRSGTMCEGFVNQLDVIGIGTITQPKLLKTYPMQNPHGLGIDGNLLFICDGAAGLKVFNASNPYQIAQNQIAHFQNIRTYDVIPNNGVLLLIGDDGLFQYDYSNPQQILLLSQIPIVKP